MSRESVLIILAVLVILSPFSGLPLSWLEFLLPVIGALMLGIGITLRRRATTLSSEPAAE